MTAAMVSDTIGCVPDDWDIDAWLADSFAVWRDEKQDVVLRVPSSSAARPRHWRLHAQQKMEDLADGELRIRFATGGMRELAEHLFTWGGELVIEGQCAGGLRGGNRGGPHAEAQAGWALRSEPIAVAIPRG